VARVWETEQGISLAELVRARRRRRLELSVEPFEVLPRERLTHDQNRPLSVADILRSGRRRVQGSNEHRRGAVDNTSYRLSVSLVARISWHVFMEQPDSLPHHGFLWIGHVNNIQDAERLLARRSQPKG
jgi:hypothetical protein